MKVWAIAATNLRRFVRDRTNLFFVFVFPLALVFLIGLQFGGGDGPPRIGVVGPDTGLPARITDELAQREVEVVEVPDRDELVDRVGSRDLDAGVVVPADLDDTAAEGTEAEIGFVARRDGLSAQLRPIVDDSVATALAGPTAARAVVERGATPAAADAAVGAVDAGGTIEVRTTSTGDRLFPEGLETFDVAAPAQLVLFVFVTGLSGSAALILTRKLGMSRRMLSTPTPVRTIILGEAVARFAIGVVQGAYILLATLLLFGVDWGDPLGAVTVLVLFGGVVAGGAMLLGTLTDNEEAASGLGIVAGLGLAALGGAMLPIELFGDTMLTVARLTPHFWALDAFAELIRHDASVIDIAPQLAVLAGLAVVLLLLASWRMRRVLTRAG